MGDFAATVLLPGHHGLGGDDVEGVLSDVPGMTIGPVHPVATAGTFLRSEPVRIEDELPLCQAEMRHEQ